MANPIIENAQQPRRWDPIVKLTHWGIVASVIANALFTKEGSGWHVWVGYGLAALLALRLLWGIIGPREARFSAFPPSPTRALHHIAEIRRKETVRHSSHNPLGALMVYAIWSCLAVIVATGIAMSGPPPANPNLGGKVEEHVQSANFRYVSRDEGDATEALEGEHSEGSRLSGRDEEGEGEEVTEEMHEVAVNLLYALIALHLLGVIFETRRSGREVLSAMLPGGNRSKT